MMEEDVFEIYIRKWLDYSNKYGVGYLLTNGDIGVYFNDASKMIIKHGNTSIVYIEKQILSKNEAKHFFEEDNCPVELEKKMILAKNFRKHFVETGMNNDQNIKNDEFSDLDMIYLKKWIKTKHAMLFRLSNSIIQVFFKDNSQILLNSEAKRVMYLGENGEKTVFTAEEAAKKEGEFGRRLQYTKEILSQISKDGK